MSGLYFSDNFPTVFNLIGYSILLDGDDITYQFEDSVESIFFGNNCYYGIIDDPDESIEHVLINQGDTLILTIKLTCPQAGSYIFPLHTSTFYGNSTAFFAADNSYEINVTPAADQTPPSAITDMEAM